MDAAEITTFARSCHEAGAWIAGSVRQRQMPAFWAAGVDVICVRGAACDGGEGRLGTVNQRLVRDLVASIPVHPPLTGGATHRP